jgi:cytochrome P450
MALSPAIVIAAGALVSYFLYTRITLYFARQRFMKEHGCQPCKSRYNKDPFFGLDVVREFTYNAKHHILLQENQKRFARLGTTFYNRLMTSPFIATCEPENVKTILSLKFKEFSFGNRQQSFGPLLGHGIFVADGERWANSRHLLRPNFARDQVADLEAFERHFRLMMKHIPRDGATVDLQELFFRLTMDSATEFLFNHSTNSLRMSGQDDESNEDVIFGKAFNYAQDDITTRFRYGPFNWLRKNEKGEEAIRICHAYVDKFVDVALQFREDMDTEKKAGSKEEKYYFIHEVAKQTKDKKRIRDELVNILLAGRDTTASLLSNMWFELARRPEIYAKLREEIAGLNGQTPSYEELRNLKYLKWCLNECTSSTPLIYLYGLLANNQTQLSASTPSSLETRAWQPATRSSRAAAAPTANTPSSSPKAPRSATRPTSCTAGKTSTGPTQTSTGPSAGKPYVQDGSISPSTAGRESVWGSNTHSRKRAM